MKVAYCSPFVPPEWIAAHGLRPVWLPGISRPVTGAQRGVCRCANLLIEPMLEPPGVDAFVLTTICDQMRYTAAYLDGNGKPPVFLLNVPSTWEGAEVRELYRDELARLGRFLESIGGRAPSPSHMQLMMQRYEEARLAARGNWPTVCDVHYAERLAELRDDGKWSSTSQASGAAHGGVPLALVGGPLLSEDFVFLELVAAAGGNIVLDASEWGERTLPAPLDRGRLTDDPLGELSRIYFAAIPDVFRRPNTLLYDWLGTRIVARGARGILFWRRLFCDLWHAELDVMRRWSPVPLLDIDVAEGDGHAAARTSGRLEAFLEMLR